MARMTYKSAATSLAAVLLFSSSGLAQHRTAPVPKVDERQVERERVEFDRMRSVDPSTGTIPANMRAKELEFAAKHFSRSHATNAPSVSTNWRSRGPANIGGRTHAIGIDVANQNVILAGGTTGGMWRSADRGTSWIRVTPLSYPPSVYSLAQDTRAGKTNTWYYGTGELGGNTGGYPLWLVSGSFPYGNYFGNGIYKSTDDGLSWSLLTSTTADTLGSYVQPFNFVHALAVDPSNLEQDELYAAVAGGIERSTDGGASWTMVLGDAKKGGGFSDVLVTSTGTVYAFIGSISATRQQFSSQIQGLFRSDDGIHWTSITPAEWRGASWYVNIAIPAVNEHVVYFACDDTLGQPSFWKYSYLGGDGSGTNGIFEDRSLGARDANTGGITYMNVLPSDENMVFLGGVYLVRSQVAFETPSSEGINGLHADQNAIAFFADDPKRAIIGTDGGMTLTEDITAAVPVMRSLNQEFVTSQFYTVAIDHAEPGSATLLGGMQDNSTYVTLTSDASQPWVGLLGGDGAGCGIQDHATSLVVSYQQANMYRMAIDEFGEVIDYAYLKPTGVTNTLFFNPLTLDRANSDRLYVPGGISVWRCPSLNAIPYGSSNALTKGWDEFSKTRIAPISSVVGAPKISALMTSVRPADRLVYGTSDGRLFRIDQASVGNPSPTDIWTGKGFPANAYVSSIAVDEDNADNLLVVFANYHVLSIFSSTNGGDTWHAVGGDLEEFPDGSGNGPACRTVGILHSGNGIVYLVGTTTGLYSTASLAGMSTHWSLEAPSVIGNNIVNMIDTRSSDGLVAVATCGHGVLTGNFEPVSGVTPTPKPAQLSLECSNNPARRKATFVVTSKTPCDAVIRIVDQLGAPVLETYNLRLGVTSTEVQMDVHSLASGTYYCELSDSRTSVVRPLIVVR